MNEIKKLNSFRANSVYISVREYIGGKQIQVFSFRFFGGSVSDLPLRDISFLYRSIVYCNDLLLGSYIQHYFHAMICQNILFCDLYFITYNVSFELHAVSNEFIKSCNWCIYNLSVFRIKFKKKKVLKHILNFTSYSIFILNF